MSTQSSNGTRRPVGWRTPIVMVICGCLIAMLAFGPRSSLGFFLTPMSQDTTGAAKSSRWRSPSRICCGVSVSLLPAALPTASAPPA